jgi:DNA-damage-inducible protein D
MDWKRLEKEINYPHLMGTRPTIPAEVDVAQYDDYVQQLETIRRLADDDTEYWLARDLQSALGYDRWENFSDVIVRAMEGCEKAGIAVDNHFRETTKMIRIGKGGARETDDWFVSRYACYFIAMSADSGKPQVAFAKTYFTIQARRQEQQDQLAETTRRRELRDRVKDANKDLNAAAKDAGVTKYGVFHDAGYKGLYGGLGKPELQARKGIDAKEDFLDCIGHTELAANYFRITQTQQKLERDQICTEREAINTHGDVGKEVRETMERISGTRPEDLPAEASLKKLKNVRQKSLVGAGSESEPLALGAGTIEPVD